MQPKGGRGKLSQLWVKERWSVKGKANNDMGGKGNAKEGVAGEGKIQGSLRKGGKIGGLL